MCISRFDVYTGIGGAVNQESTLVSNLEFANYHKFAKCTNCICTQTPNILDDLYSLSNMLKYELNRLRMYVALHRKRLLQSLERRAFKRDRHCCLPGLERSKMGCRRQSESCHA